MLVWDDWFVDPTLETATLISSGDGITSVSSTLILFISEDTGSTMCWSFSNQLAWIWWLKEVHCKNLQKQLSISSLSWDPMSILLLSKTVWALVQAIVNAEWRTLQAYVNYQSLLPILLEGPTPIRFEETWIRKGKQYWCGCPKSMELRVHRMPQIPGIGNWKETKQKVRWWDCNVFGFLHQKMLELIKRNNCHCPERERNLPGRRT